MRGSSLCQRRGLLPVWWRHSLACGGVPIGRAGVTARLIAPLVLLLLCAQPAWAQHFHFDPASCKHDTGHMYIAFGRTVLTVPTPKQADAVVDPIHPGEAHLTAPDPTDPTGCSGNPLQSDSYASFDSITLLGAAPENTELGVPDLLLIVNLNRGVSLSAQDGAWAPQRDNHDIAEELCRTATVREQLPNGLMACRVKPTEPANAPRVDWGASYIAKKNVYSAPLGRTFVVICSPGLYSDGIGYCNVTYQISHDIGLTYRFQPHLTTHPIPISQIIAFDKSLRVAIENAIVKNYPWPR